MNKTQLKFKIDQVVNERIKISYRADGHLTWKYISEVFGPVVGLFEASKSRVYAGSNPQYHLLIYEDMDLYPGRANYKSINYTKWIEHDYILKKVWENPYPRYSILYYESRYGHG